MKIFTKCIAIPLFILIAMTSSYAQQVEVGLQVLPPFRFNLDLLTGQLLATVRNTGSQPLSVNFRLEMTGPEGLIIQSDRVFEEDINMEGGVVKQFRGGDWDDLFESVSLSIAPESERTRLESEQAFREGDYQICLIAYNPNTGTQLSSGAPSDCTDFTVEAGDAPEIITPFSDTEIDINHAPLHITWMHTNITSGSIEYEIIIVDVTHNSGRIDTEQVFSGGSIEVREEGIVGLSYLLEEEDIEWVPGNEYVVRISAIDTEGSIFFENAGHSQPVRFRIAGEEEDVASLGVIPHYPMEHDTIPFLTFPVVVEFSPKSPTISRMDFSTVFNGNAPVTGDLRWNATTDGGGALEYLQRHFPEAIWDQAVLQPVLDVQAPMVERAGQYDWSSIVTLYETFTAQDPITTATQSFVVGMPTPAHQSPANNATVPAGEINFQWKSGGEQTKIIPDYKLYHIDSDDTAVASLGDVHEHWVLQVFSANSTGREGLVKQYHGSLDAGSEELFDPDTRELDPELLNQKLYTDLNHSFTITEEGEYWWRMAWLRNPDMTESGLENLVEAEVYHASPLHKFTIGSPETVTTEEDTDCTSNCIIEAPNSTGTTAISVGHKTKIGKFELEVKTITGETDGKYTGTGFVTIPFLNNLKITVNFISIKANAENKIYTGTVKVKHDNSFVTSDVVAGGLEILKVDETTANEIDTFISDSGRTISALVAGSEISLPIGWDYEVDGKRIRLAIMDIDFTKTSAEMDAVALVDIPYVSDDGEEYERVVSLGAKELCINPGGIGSDGKFYVPEDFEFNPSDENVFAIKGYTEAGTSRVRGELDYTYLKWDCNGFKELHVAMQIKFSRETIVPEDDEGQPEAEGNVIASANFNLNKTDEKFNLLSQVTFNKSFQIPKENANGWGFEANNIWLDLSTVANPPDITFPEGYVFDTDGRLANTWKGFWIERLAIKAPHFIESADASRRTVDLAVNNFIIDPKLSFSFRIENLVPLDADAAVDGTHISLDNVFFDVMQNNFRRAGFDGKIALPIAEDKAPQMFQYQVMLDNAISSDDEVEEGETPERRLGLVLSARPAADTIYIKAKGFMMEGAIAKSSFIELGYRGEIYTKFELNGRFGISTDNDDSLAERSFSLNMPSIKIEGLKFDSSKPTNKFECDDCFHTSLASPQKSMSGFPLSLKSINLDMIEGKPALSIEPQITFMGESGGFSASAVINIIANLRKEEGKWKFSIDDANVSKISLDELEISSLKLSGFIEFYKEGDSKGTRGALAVQLPSGIAGSLSADFGAVKTADATSADYDKNEKWYSYWYLEGQIMFGTSGLPFGAVALYGLGGGASYHMTQSGLPSTNTLAADVGTESGTVGKITGEDGIEKDIVAEVVPSGSSYAPRFDTGLGLKFTALFGSPGGGKVYNFDVGLEAEFNNEGGLRRFGFNGSARVMPDQTKPFTDTGAPIQAYVSIDIDRIDEPDNLLVQGHFILSLNFFNIIKGNATSLAIDPGADYTGPRENIFIEAAFMSDKGSDEWYYVMGKPKESERGGIRIDLFGKEIASTKGYFLAGNALEKLGITLGMPSPVQAFLDIQHMAQGTDDAHGGEFYGMEAVEDALQEPDGSITTGMYDAAGKVQGFQFGMSMDMHVDARVMPFYFVLDMALGFDVLSKYVATCDVYADGIRTGSLSPPGDEGWYSEGQFYAGINAEFGLFIDLWFIQKEFTIFQAAAALLLQGNIPNPDGFRGEGDIYFSVLGGLVDGQYHFEIEKGSRCVAPMPGAADLLSQLEIIQDLKPSRGNDNSVFSVPQAAFSIAIEKELELPVSEDQIIVIKPFIKAWTLKRSDNNAAVSCENFKMTEHNTQSILQPIAALNGRTRYKQKLRVEAWELKDGRQVPIYNKDSIQYGIWYEDKEVTFTTGDMPDVVEPSNVLYTYPIHNQKHFLKGETEAGKGYVVLKMAQNSGGKVFDTGGEFGDKDFVARFIKIDGSNDNFETPLELWHSASRVLKFDITNLENNQTYLLQLLSRKRVTETNQGSLLASSGMGTNVNTPLREAIQAAAMGSKLGYLKSKYAGAQERRLPDNLTLNSGEKILYKYYFRTSVNNNFMDKVSGLDWQATLNTAASSKNESISISAVWDEFPERYDKSGYTNPSNRFQVPRLMDANVKVYTGEFDRYPEYPINNYIKFMHHPNFSVPALIIAYKFRRNDLGVIQSVNQTYADGVDFGNGSRIDRPLSMSEIRNALNATATSAVTTTTTYTSAATTNPTGISSGYGFAGSFMPAVAGGIDLTPKVIINHEMPRKGYEYLGKVKDNIHPVFLGSLDVWTVETKTLAFAGFDRPIRGTCHKLVNKYYNTKYRAKYSEKRLHRFIISKPTAMQYLQEFDYPIFIKTMQLLFRSNVGYPKYNNSNRRVPVSFILDYKYPSSRWPGSGAEKASMVVSGNNYIRIEKTVN